METHDFFKCLSDPTRLRLLVLLRQCDRLCVCDLMDLMDVPQSRLSRHLKQLRDCALVVAERQDQWMYYAINPNLDAAWLDLLKHNCDALIDQSPHREDILQITTPVAENCC